jgi:hypothetical protein
MAFTCAQFICHLLGDYPLQSSWMALNKTKRTFPAAVHALVYFVPFLIFLKPSVCAGLVIIGTHFLIDRFRLARYVAYLKEFIAPPSEWKRIKWNDFYETGFHRDTPAHMSSWLLIIVDNTLHLLINGLALTYL